MKGFVPTPAGIVDLMVEKLFAKRVPKPENRILDPGCGTGAFIDGIVRWCETRRCEVPRIVGIESDPKHIPGALTRFSKREEIQIRNADFLVPSEEKYDYIIGNPPYVSITRLSPKERSAYRMEYSAAKGRFDLYFLFFEQALRSLGKNGRLVFITPEKYMYTESARPLRSLIGGMHVEEIHQLSEGAFGDLVTYPTVTTLSRPPRGGKTSIILRDGTKRDVLIPKSGDSWLPHLVPNGISHSGITLEDLSLRISCGVATGADSVFIVRTEDLDKRLTPFAFPIVSGRDLNSSTKEPSTRHSILSPYERDGRLKSEGKLGFLKAYLSQPDNREKLLSRTCTQRKPWYAYHDNFPLPEMLVPKILCKDITPEPRFWIDKEGGLVPRHTVYYIVPKPGADIERLCGYLNSDDAKKWLESNCQRAANGFLRLQSNNLKRLPIPQDVLRSPGRV